VTPSSEVEWEELLVRLEIMPRALRFVLDGVESSRDAAVILDELVAREERAGMLLERAAGSSGQVVSRGAAEGADAALASRVECFIRQRSRNFAIVQRRGVDVWGWSMTSPGGTEISAFQLLAFLARGDVTTLAALRTCMRVKAETC
jgi:hypothetical protein